MKKLIIILLIIAFILTFILPWWGAEEEPQIKKRETNTILTNTVKESFTGKIPYTN